MQSALECAAPRATSTADLSIPIPPWDGTINFPALDGEGPRPHARFITRRRFHGPQLGPPPKRTIATLNRASGPRFPQFHSQIFGVHAKNCVDTNQATI